MRLTDWFLVIPWLALALVLASILGPTLLNVVVVISVTTWAFTARVVRAQALTVKSRPYVERAKALGGSNWQVITRHVLPNTFPIIFAQTILIAASAILTEATLAFLGLGDPQSVSWGKMLEEGFNQGAITTGRLWLIIPPGVCIVLLVLSLTMIGYAFDQILNPRLRDR
jgi:peptide/nickel transport system permease protein